MIRNRISSAPAIFSKRLGFAFFGREARVQDVTGSASKAWAPSSSTGSSSRIVKSAALKKSLISAWQSFFASSEPVESLAQYLGLKWSYSQNHVSRISTAATISGWDCPFS